MRAPTSAVLLGAPRQRMFPQQIADDGYQPTAAAQTVSFNDGSWPISVAELEDDQRAGELITLGRFKRSS